MAIRATQAREAPKTPKTGLNPFAWLRGAKPQPDPVSPQARTQANLAHMRATQGPGAPRGDADRGQGLSEEDYLDIPAFLRRQAN
jgi:cell division protein FtsZ